MIERNGNRIIGDNWEEMDVVIPPNKSFSTTDIKVKCPSCKELGKRSEPSLSVSPTKGVSKCHKCGASFIIRTKIERAERVEKTFTPPSKKNMTALKEDGLKMLTDRMISQEAINNLKIVQEGDYIAFPYFDSNGDLVNVKYRGIHEKKFRQSAGGMHIMYNHHRVLQYLNSGVEPKAVLILEGECFTPDTEVLTKSGWVSLSSYSGEDVLQINQDKTSSFVRPLAIIEKYYNGDLVQYKSGSYKMLTTPDHNMVRIGKNGEYFKCLASDRAKKTYKIPRVTEHDGSGLNLSDDQIKFAIATSADFTFRKTGDLYARFKKQRKIDRITSITSNLGIQASIKSTPADELRGFTSVFIKKNHGLDYCSKLFNHEWLYKMSIRQKLLFINELVQWDGNTVPNRNQIEYATKEYSNAVFVQTLSHLCGYTSTIIRRENQWGKWFKVSILFSKQHSASQKGFLLVPYSGMVKCVSVPSGMLLVRHKESISVSGNCDVASFETAGVPFGVSVDVGAIQPNQDIGKKLDCLTNSFELFETAETIYVGVDNDDAGRALKNELVRRLNIDKVKIVDFGKYKDANEFLKWEGREKLVSLLDEAKSIRMEGIFSLSDIETKLDDMFNNGLPKGETSGFPSLDKHWKPRVGEVSIATSWNNEGKSSLFAINFPVVKAVLSGWKTGAFVPENFPAEEFYEELIMCHAGGHMDPDFPQSRITLSQYKASKAFIDKHYFLVMPEKNQTTEELFARFDYLVRKEGIRIALFDPYNMIEHLFNRNETIDQYVSRFMTMLKRWTTNRQLCTILVAHQNPPKTRAANGKDFPRPESYNLKGGGSFSDKADNVIYFYRPYRFSDESNPLSVFGSDKIRRKKLLNAKPGESEIFWNWKTGRYEDPLLLSDEERKYKNGKSPLDVSTGPVLQDDDDSQLPF